MKNYDIVAESSCYVCGTPLSPATSTRLPTSLTLSAKKSPICISCQQKYYRQLEGTVGASAALYLTCAAFNVPYLSIVAGKLQKTDGADVAPWVTYIRILRESDINGKRWRYSDFTEGETKAGTDYAPSADDVSPQAMWGYGPEERPYTDEDYRFMQENYDALTENRANVTEQAVLAIKKICRFELEQRRCIDVGDYTKAKALGDMIKTEKEGEQLRKKDELPQDHVRIDDLVLACERKGIPLYDFDELAKVLANYSLHKPYFNCRDVADQVVLQIRNTTAWNEGRAEVARLSDDSAIQDWLGEFEADKQTPEGERIYKELQIAPLNMPDSGAEDRAKLGERTPFPNSEDDE